MDDFEFQELDARLLKRIEETWAEQIESMPAEKADVFWPTLERQLSWWKGYADPGTENGDWRLYVVTTKDGSGGHDMPVAVVDMTDAHKSKDPSLKLLDFNLQPILLLQLEEEVDSNTIGGAIHIIGFAIVSAMNLAYQNGVRKFKIYGRSPELLNMFDTLVATAGDWGKYQVYRQQKWLVIESAGGN